jgi:hypothetical protein
LFPSFDLILSGEVSSLHTPVSDPTITKERGERLRLKESHAFPILIGSFVFVSGVERRGREGD